MQPADGYPFDLKLRRAVKSDSISIAEIYNQGIEDRTATFETDPRTGKDVEGWFDRVHPIVVAELEREIIAFASTFPYSSRACYSGIAEFSVYVKREFRGLGAGGAIMKYLIDQSRQAGLWKLVSRIFIENGASRSLMKSLGFREVGIYEKHGNLDGIWKDTMIVELLIQENTR